MKKIGMSYHSFETAFYIWQQLRVKKTSQLPIPPCNRILPITHSFWNNAKGASDTATKLMWNCQIKFCSSGRSQLIATTKFLQLYSIFLHRQHQIANTKDNLNFYASLHHLRNTKNRHQPYHKTLDTLSDLLIKKADNAAASTAAVAAAAEARAGLTIDTNIEEVPTDGSIQSPPRVARFNPRSSFGEIRNYTTIMGGTSGKGRAKN